MGILIFPHYSVLQRQIIPLVKVSGNCSVKCFVLESAGLSKQNPSTGTVRGTKVKNSAENILNSENHLSCDCSTHLYSLSSIWLHSPGTDSRTSKLIFTCINKESSLPRCPQQCSCSFSFLCYSPWKTSSLEDNSLHLSHCEKMVFIALFFATKYPRVTLCSSNSIHWLLSKNWSLRLPFALNILKGEIMYG